MGSLGVIRALLQYSDGENRKILHAAAALGDAQLDHPFEMGPGTLRRTLLHTYNGEHVWLCRWQEARETPWPSEDERVSMNELRERFDSCWAERETFLDTLQDTDLDRAIVYRDSRGSLFRASLRDMLLQGCVHSVHHRAQSTNMIRNLGGPALEMDYMMSLRQPAG